ncbi:phosphoglycerate kinase [Sulfobacillus sp. hq2]|uniref:Phosphoglycerate kinase n=1 Tax=Sulfobacillus thermotolerans TaxID=338644 RepID=A0ABM6RR86_9FIRM|nr:phosphoglycerate kinase [Sulfobacillus sp. hq2]AUW93897.1 phosphoglycerate kinase [Sulfobacillus thermotolerans]MCY0908699.1 phosphoglycerate kinase [Sulfobacillus thermotolerans]POB11291.1 phosphoglycerate kinase [Sulfobacillus sp. hq2]
MTLTLRRMKDMDSVYNKRILVRVDFNVPIDPQTGYVGDETRIQAVLPTLNQLLRAGARVVVMSHKGRPHGWDETQSLAPVVRYVQSLLDYPVRFIDSIVSDETTEAVNALKPGEMLILQNLRFDPREQANDPEFAKALAALGDAYVDDAFSTAHRSDASIVGIPQYLPAYAGHLMETEVMTLEHILGRPARPYWAIVGGAKVPDKLAMLLRLVDKLDGLVLGGAMATTFLAAKGYPIGRSLYGQGLETQALDILSKAQARHVPVILPEDVMVAPAIGPNVPSRLCALDDVHDDEHIVDIGPMTVQRMAEAIEASRTVLWNGPMGVFEYDAFAYGTLMVANKVADMRCAVVVGGGDTVAAIAKAGVSSRMTHISTGGGALLQWVEGEELPGLRVLYA